MLGITRRWTHWTIRRSRDPFLVNPETCQSRVSWKGKHFKSWNFAIVLFSLIKKTYRLFSCDVMSAMLGFRNKRLLFPWDINSFLMQIRIEHFVLFWPPTWLPCHVVSNEELADQLFSRWVLFGTENFKGLSGNGTRGRTNTYPQPW